LYKNHIATRQTQNLAEALYAGGLQSFFVYYSFAAAIRPMQETRLNNRRLELESEQLHMVDAISSPNAKNETLNYSRAMPLITHDVSMLCRFFSFASSLIIFMIICGFLTTDAHAYTVEKHPDQVTGQLVVSPTKYDLKMKPGETSSQDIMVANRTGNTQTIEFSVEDFEGSDDPAQATVFMGDEDSNWGARRWIEPELGSIVLNQGETVTFRAKISVPRGAEPGGHYAALFSSSDMDTTDEQGSAISVTSRVGCLFLITVSGDVVEDGYLSPPEAPTFAEYGPMEIGLVFNNTGNVHLKPAGRIIISNFLGQTVAEIPVKEWVVLPESSRRNLVEWDQHYLFGRYTVRAEITFGSDGQQVITSQNLWAMPWKIVLAVIALLIIFILLISLLVHRRRSGRRELKTELEELRSKGTGVIVEHAPKPEKEAPAAAETERPPSRLIELNVLFPSTEDARVINLADPETQELVRDLINNELDLARAFIGDGNLAQARHELQEARSAAQIAGLLAEVGIIDDMLQPL
jgi:hypothetical protein